jgi:pSer/pThr/pTyr-binding forkhead associated (FHA) protein
MFNLNLVWLAITLGVITALAIILTALWVIYRNTQVKRSVTKPISASTTQILPPIPQPTQTAQLEETASTLPTPPKPLLPQPIIEKPVIPYLESTLPARKFFLLQIDQENGDLIGRDMTESGVTVRIDDGFPQWQSVSRHHARIYRQEGKVIIEDNESQNGILVEGRRTVRNLLKDGWKVTIGGVEFIYHE